MNGDSRLYQILDQLGISFEYHEHPPAPTIEEAIKYWKDMDATHCKNIFFRNHKGNRHYLVVLEHMQQLSIHDLEQRLKQGKLSRKKNSKATIKMKLQTRRHTLFLLTKKQQLAQQRV